MLDPCHTTITSSSADQMIQFARAVVLGVMLASYRFLDDFLLHACGVCSLGGGGEVGRSPSPSLNGSTVASSVASQ